MSGEDLSGSDAKDRLDRGYTSDSEIYSHYANHTNISSSNDLYQNQQRNEWILVSELFL